MRGVTEVAMVRANSGAVEKHALQDDHMGM
jgi:hypothetical protein